MDRIYSLRNNTHTNRNTQSIVWYLKYEGWNFNSGNYLFTTDTK